MNEVKERIYKEKFYCPTTDKEEIQTVVKESEDGITLKCRGCEKEHDHEIGEVW